MVKLNKNKGSAVLLTASGEYYRLGGSLTIENVKKLIDADLIEFCQSKTGGMLLIDESGKLKGKKENIAATIDYKYNQTIDDEDGSQHLVIFDSIVGDVVWLSKMAWQLLDSEEDDGEPLVKIRKIEL